MEAVVGVRACEVCCDDMFHAGQQLCGLEQQGCGPDGGSQSRHARPDQDVGVVRRVATREAATTRQP